MNPYDGQNPNNGQIPIFPNMKSKYLVLDPHSRLAFAFGIVMDPPNQTLQ